MREYTFETIKGVARKKNEDDLLIIEENEYQLFFVFDGVSRAKNSDVAIEKAHEFISSNYHDYFVNSDFKLIDLMIDVNDSIISSGLSRALTTYCAVFGSVGEKERVKYSSLGDSRLYTISEQKLHQLSTDDRLNEQSNVITKCLGMNLLKRSDFREETVNVGNKRVLICTDGFYRLLEEDVPSFCNMLTSPDINGIKSGLSQLVIGNNIDDATYILIS